MAEVPDAVKMKRTQTQQFELWKCARNLPLSLRLLYKPFIMSGHTL